MQATRDRFVTQWRPPTSFGYKNDFDLEKHLKKEGRRRRRKVKETEKNVVEKQFYYFSKPVAITEVKKCSVSAPNPALKGDTRRRLSPVERQNSFRSNNLESQVCSLVQRTIALSLVETRLEVNLRTEENLRSVA
eukprot:GFUD01096548.1.p1 GENE.GFUD01096548.1~~GFUD01096548.1.p1  ORF type:complete len:135 (-),score=51.53 GFUD01096548.1:3-407(-)